MGSRLGKRVIHFANLPIKLLMPSSFENIREIGLKTIPSATKIEIKRVLESLYGFEVEKVRTMNVEGKKKHRGGILLAKADYKKAYVTLKYPLSLNSNLFPISLVAEDRKNKEPKQSKEVIVEKGSERRSHWLDEAREESVRATYRPGKQGDRRPIFLERRVNGCGNARESRDDGKTKFPWSSMCTKRKVESKEEISEDD